MSNHTESLEYNRGYVELISWTYIHTGRATLPRQRLLTLGRCLESSRPSEKASSVLGKKQRPASEYPKDDSGDLQIHTRCRQLLSPRHWRYHNRRHCCRAHLHAPSRRSTRESSPVASMPVSIYPYSVPPRLLLSSASHTHFRRAVALSLSRRA